MMEANRRPAAIAAALVVVAALVLAAMWYHSSRGAAAEGFCGGSADPAAASEARALYEMGAVGRGVPSNRVGYDPEARAALVSAAARCGSNGAAGAVHPAAIAEATGLQSAGALQMGAPYHVKGGFRASPGDAREAAGEGRLLQALQGGADGFALQKLGRDQPAYAAQRRRREALHAANPAHTPSRRARLDSMREGFGGPPAKGYGWEPTSSDFQASPDGGGWGDAQSVGAAQCHRNCVDGCVGTHCSDHCMDSCRERSLAAASGLY